MTRPCLMLLERVRPITKPLALHSPHIAHPRRVSKDRRLSASEAAAVVTFNTDFSRNWNSSSFAGLVFCLRGDAAADKDGTVLLLLRVAAGEWRRAASGRSVSCDLTSFTGEQLRFSSLLKPVFSCQIVG